ncbi:PepSY domain-containing protein [Candidatus Nitrotoga sp. HW29]|uniref:PepSY domain-containing protein n=1 Tax=Candidatus Nitrotoga sp. HW29 TaxID=2886963 RepID=UPI001EF37BC6|nr:PepSY domain-containing protein [Candidatus Nitrotoga sp. HW29]
MMKNLINGILISTFGLGVAPAYSQDPGANNIKINNHNEHNINMLQCVRTALEKHSGAVIEAEFEKTEDKLIFEVEIQGKDGKNWEIICDAITGDVIKDEEDKEDKKEGEKNKQ